MFVPKSRFTNSHDYWVNRYKKGGNSGPGSYNNLAQFKAEVLNQFIQEKNIKNVIEFGSGDGNQLELLNFNTYTGFDISKDALEICRKKFAHDNSKSFLHMQELSNQMAELTLSLDVLFHLIEEDVYENYLKQLFDHSSKFVIIYAYDSNASRDFAPHVKPRKFTDWVNANRTAFKLIQHIPNKYPFNKANSNSTSISDFYIFEKQ